MGVKERMEEGYKGRVKEAKKGRNVGRKERMMERNERMEEGEKERKSRSARAQESYLPQTISCRS